MQIQHEQKSLVLVAVLQSLLPLLEGRLPQADGALHMIQDLIEDLQRLFHRFLVSLLALRVVLLAPRATTCCRSGAVTATNMTT